MKTMTTIGSVMSGLALACVSFALSGCFVQPTESQDLESKVITSDEAPGASPQLTPLSSPPYCKRQWECGSTGKFYGTKADCTAACGAVACDLEANCGLSNCICP